jgi:hypothetical protein
MEISIISNTRIIAKNDPQKSCPELELQLQEAAWFREGGSLLAQYGLDSATGIEMEALRAAKHIRKQ